MPATAKTAKKLKALEVKTATAWPRLKRNHTANEFCEPTTASGNKTKEAALTTRVKRAARARMADKLAKKIVRRESGRGTRLVESRRSRKSASQRQRAAAPGTVERTTGQNS